MSSPGTGEQHLAKRTSMSSMPFTTTAFSREMPFLRLRSFCCLAEAFLQLLVAGNQLAHDCAEPYASVTYRGVHFVDVVEHVTFACGGNCVRGKQIRRQESAMFTVAFHHGFSGADVFFLKLALEKRLIFAFADGVVAIFIQSRDGPFALGLVRTSTVSPVFSGVLSGTILLFTFTPTHLLPTWLCIA